MTALLLDRLNQYEFESLKDVLLEVGEYVLALEKRVEYLENEIKSDIHEHVKSLVNQIQTLETEIKTLK
ncbi:MAG: hypothetical protein JSV09_08575 [Thermoplasmata archaeon]|nr:MAG: hypothetical protein JSV09_08575 [Thermoplasmata archaeon]